MLFKGTVMVDTSSMYNLSNPALYDDIGLTCLEKQQALPTGSLGGYNSASGLSSDRAKLKGALAADTFESTRKEKDKSIFKKLLKGAGLLAAGVLCYKFGKKIIGFIKGKFKH